MAKAPSKLYIRSEVLAVLDFFQQHKQPQRTERERQVRRLAQLPDRATVLRILLRELSRHKALPTLQTIGELLVELGDIATLHDPLWSLIAAQDVCDEAKDVANLVLRHLGDESDPELYLEYLQDPSGLISRETQRMLELSLQNPEALVDFIDFIFSLPIEEQQDLLASLQEDYAPDSLVPLYLPLLAAQPEWPLRKQMFTFLGEHQQVQATDFVRLYLESLANETDSPTVQQERKLVQKTLARLSMRVYGPKSALPQQHPDNGVQEGTTTAPHKRPLQQPASGSSPEPVQWLADSEMGDCYATIPDGVGNQGLLLSRRWRNGDIMMLCAVVNDTHGVMDSFGFYQISPDDFERLVQKFHEESSKVQVPPVYAAVKLMAAEQRNWIQHNRMPYEFYCWKGIVQDVPLDIHALEQGLDRLVQPPLAVMTQNLYQHPDFDPWFLEEGDWPPVTELLDTLPSLLKDYPGDSVLFAMNGLVRRLLVTILTSEWGAILSARLWDAAFLLQCQRTPTFARLAATEAALLDRAFEPAQLEDMDGRFLLAYARRCVREELLRLRFHAPASTSDNDGEASVRVDERLVQEALERLIPAWGVDTPVP